MADAQTDAVTKHQQDFGVLLEGTIASSIRDLLGDSPAQAILYYLQPDGLGSDPRVFHTKLSTLLGQPSVILEETVVKELFRRMEVLYVPKGDFDFERYVKSARDYYSHGRGHR
jgi:hypothetical protein